MLRQKCSYKNGIETFKQQKSKEKNRTKVCKLNKTDKTKLLAENADI